MSVEVWIPWRPQPSRVPAQRFVDAWWRRHGFAPQYVDVPGELFNLAACRNEAVRSSKADVIVIADADTLPQVEALERAIELAADEHGTVLPYTEYRSLQDRGSHQAITLGRLLESCAHIVIDGACSGIFVTTKTGWGKHLGQDELFAGWGCEDAAWYLTHETLIATPLRVPGVVFAMTHDSADKDGEPTRNNYARIFHYEQAKGDPERIRHLAGGGAV